MSKKGSSGPVTQWHQLLTCDLSWHSHGSLITGKFDRKINRSTETSWQEYCGVACSYSSAPARDLLSQKKISKSGKNGHFLETLHRNTQEKSAQVADLGGELKWENTTSKFVWMTLHPSSICLTQRAREKNYYSKEIFKWSGNMYLLTEWEGRTGKYLARGHGVRTERHERGPNIFPSGPT